MSDNDILNQPDDAFEGGDSVEETRASLKQIQGQKNPAVRLTEWKKEPSVRDLKKDLQNSTQARNFQVGEVERWTELREGGKKLRKRRGRSSVRPKLIRRQAEWRYSSLSEPFLSSDKIFTIKPRTFEDGPAAAQNELLLNWQFQTKLNLVDLVDEYVRTGVDEGTVILRVGWKRETEMVDVEVPVYKYLEVYEGTPEEQALAEALQIQAADPKAFSELDPALIASIEYSQENSVAAWAVNDGTTMVKEEKVTLNEPTVGVMDYRNIYVDPTCRGDVDKANFIIISFETSKAELIADGRYKNLNAVNWPNADILSEPDHQTEIPDGFNFEDDLRKRIVAYEYWGKADLDGSGRLQPIVATWIGEQMIRMEKNPYPDQKPPFEFVTYLPKKRSLFGEPDAELIEDNQAIAGAVTRGMIDLMGRSANAQQGIQKGLLDVTNRRRWEAGEDYEFNPTGNPNAGIIQHKYPDIPVSAMNMLNVQNQEAEGLTGVKAFSGGMSGDAYGDVAAGIKGALDAASKREMNILRRFADGFKRVGARIMAMNAVFLSEEEIVRVTNEQYVTIRREDIKGEFDMMVDISTPEIDEKRAQDMAFMLQTLGPQADPAFTRLILAEIAKLKRMPDLSNEIKNFEPQPDPIAQAKAQLELKELELKIQKIQSEINKNNAHAEKLEADADATDLDTEMKSSGIKHAQDMEKQSEQARGNQDLEITRALMRSQKEGESSPDIEAGVGYNQLSKELNSASNTPKSVLPPQVPLDVGGFPVQ